MSVDDDAQAEALFRARVHAAGKRADESFAGDYAGEPRELLGLSQDAIQAIAPGITGADAHNRLISVVREASRVNVSQAALVGKIRSLGQVAVGIAKPVPKLATLLV